MTINNAVCLTLSHRSSYECSCFIHNVRVWPFTLEDAAIICLSPVSGFLPCCWDHFFTLLRWANTHLLLQELFLFLECWSRSYKLPQGFFAHICTVLYRCYTSLLWGQFHCVWPQSNSWDLCHISSTLHLNLHWILRPGFLKWTMCKKMARLYPLSTFRGSYFNISESGSGHRHAVAVSDGSVRPEKPAGCGRRWACGSGARGAAHWCLSGEQQRLCYQSHTRPGAKSLHTDGRMGHGGFQVIKYNLKSSYKTLFNICLDQG